MDGNLIPDLVPEPRTLVHYNGHARVVDDSMICGLCRHLFSNLETSSSPSNITTYYIKTKTLLVEAAAKEGCHLCILLLGAFCEPLEFGEPSSLAFFPIISASLTLDGTYSLAGGVYAKFFDEAGQTFEPGKKEAFPSYAHTSLELEPRLEFTDPTTIKAGDSTNSDLTWGCILLWLDECSSGGTHKLCQQAPRTIERPKRLLNINPSDEGDGKSVRLCENTEIPVSDRYFTLSHRWGTLQHIRLTEATLPSFKVRIPWDMLSRTFQDAISITFNLGFEWLWIDSICIIQDSLEDWSTESKNMQSIYANSFCNISAADAKDGAEGCFRDRSPLAIQPCKIMLDGETRYAIDDDSWDWNVPRYEINSRAWVMQERLLSPRILYYTKDQVIWECNHGLASEKLPYILPPKHKNSRAFNRLMIRGSLSDDMEQSPLPSKNDIQKAWNMIVSEYSQCHLTRDSDKLIALDGLTSRFRELLQEEDEFGLWPSDIEFQLTWTVASGQWGKHASRRLSPEIAPSWSWASIHDWKISPEYGGLGSDYSFHAVSHSKPSWYPEQPVSAAIFPNQRRRILGFQCMLLPVKVETIHLVITIIQATPINGDSSSTLYCYLDTDDDLNSVEAPGCEVWCAPLFSLVSKNREPTLEGLLLMQMTSEKIPTFRRVGTFSNAIDLPPRGSPLVLPRPVDLPFEEIQETRFDFPDILYKDRSNHESSIFALPSDKPSDESKSIEFEISAYDRLVKKFLQERFPGVDYPGADIVTNNGIKEHNIMLC
ncbi:hypothetical protein B7463_g8015, partial [Scytalidium lignicola]